MHSQCFVSGSALDGLLDLDPHCECGYGSIRGKISPKYREKLRQKTRKNMKISIFYAVIF
jgi:hypothetical protein